MIYFLLAILVGVLGYFVLTYNKLVKLNNDTKEAFSTMDVYLKKRWDLIPNIVETVKGYAKHEEETLEEVTKIRSSVNSYDNLSDNEKIKANEEMQNSINKIMLLAESYPELKADENFLDLQKQLSSVEDEIAQSRKYYNAVVREYNNKVEMVPSNIIAGICGYRVKDMFEAKEAERENVKVEL